MAHSSECTNQYAQKALDGANIVRAAMLRQLAVLTVFPQFRDCYKARVNHF